jgi:hypothetical protein
MKSMTYRILAGLVVILSMAACSTAPVYVQGAPVCDSYIVFDMCVRDLVGDGAVDMVYFAETDVVFMYRDGMRETVAQEMSMHRCAVSLDEELQKATDRILERDRLTTAEEWGIKRVLLAKYIKAKPEIDRCNSRFVEEDYAQEEEFYMGDSDWE